MRGLGREVNRLGEVGGRCRRPRPWPPVLSRRGLREKGESKEERERGRE